jgi:threonine 3-dehydrogenase
MKALVKSKPEPGLWMEEVPVPSPGPNDVRIKVARTSMCGTDLHIIQWDEWAQGNVDTPLIIGHEFGGRIDAVGSHVEGLRLGQRVSAEGHVTCGHCRNCQAGKRRYCRNTIGVGVGRDGAFAEYVIIPAANVFPLPDAIADDIASMLDSLGNATHTALSFDLVGEDVLITGSGPIGVMAAAVARHVGARNIVATDLSEYRLSIARQMGADLAINPTKDSVTSAMSQLGMTEGFDVGMEMSGSDRALHDLLTSMNNGGNVALLGLPSSDDAPFDWTDIIFKGLTLKGIYGRRMFETWYKMAAMLQTGLDVSPVITHTFPATAFQDALDVLATGECGKVVLDWGQV